MVVATFLIATSFPVAASLTETIDSIWLTLNRFALASLILLPYVVVKHPKEMLKSLTSIPRYAVISAPLVLFYICLFEALKTTTPIKAAALLTLKPLITFGLGFAFIGERLSSKVIYAFICGFIGSMWILLSQYDGSIFLKQLVVGDPIFLGGVFCFSFYQIIVKQLSRNEPILVMTFWTLTVGSVWLSVVGYEKMIGTEWLEIQPSAVFSMAYLAIFTTLITFYLTQQAIVLIGPTQTSAYTFLNPILTLLISWCLSNAFVSWSVVPGITLTLTSIILLQTNSFEVKP